MLLARWAQAKETGRLANATEIASGHTTTVTLDTTSIVSAMQASNFQMTEMAMSLKKIEGTLELTQFGSLFDDNKAA